MHCLPLNLQAGAEASVAHSPPSSVLYNDAAPTASRFNNRRSPSRLRSPISKTDEDKEAEQGKKNVTNDKIVAEYAKSGRSSCKKCVEKIDSKFL